VGFYRSSTVLLDLSDPDFRDAVVENEGVIERQRQKIIDLKQLLSELTRMECASDGAFL